MQTYGTCGLAAFLIAWFLHDFYKMLWLMSWGEPILGPLPRTISLVSNGSNLSLQRSASINATGRPYPPGLGWTPQVTPHDPEGLGATIQEFINPTKVKSCSTSARSAAASCPLASLWRIPSWGVHNVFGSWFHDQDLCKKHMSCRRTSTELDSVFEGQIQVGVMHTRVCIFKRICSISWITSYVVVAHLLQSDTTQSFAKTSTRISDFLAILSPWTRQWRHSSSEEVDS